MRDANDELDARFAARSAAQADARQAIANMRALLSCRRTACRRADNCLGTCGYRPRTGSTMPAR